MSNYSPVSGGTLDTFRGDRVAKGVRPGRAFFAWSVLQSPSVTSELCLLVLFRDSVLHESEDVWDGSGTTIIYYGFQNTERIMA